MFVFYGIVFIIVGFFSQSRAFVVGGLGSIITLFLLIRPAKLWLKLVLCCGYGLVLFALAFFIKTDSSLGRLLIYKISTTMLLDHPWSGIGFGAFQRDYLLYQAAYFEKRDFTSKELLLADNTYFAFNDYFQLVIEGGLFMLVWLFLYAVVIICTVKHTFTMKATNNLIAIAAFNIIAISLAAIFTHVFENTLWSTMLLLSYFMVSLHLVGSSSNVLRVITIVLLLIATGLTIEKCFDLKFQYHYQETKKLADAGYHTEALKEYGKLHGTQKIDPWFLYDYGRYMLQIDKADVAVCLIENSKMTLSFNNQYLDLGDCYYQLKQFPQAEWHYKKSAYMVPNRFHNRYKLFLFYLTLGETKKATQCAQDIVDLPIKIPSARVSFIKREATAFLKNGKLRVIDAARW